MVRGFFTLNGEEGKKDRNIWLLTLSLPRWHLKTTNKSAKFETHKPFCFIFRISVWRDF